MARLTPVPPIIGAALPPFPKVEETLLQELLYNRESHTHTHTKFSSLNLLENLFIALFMPLTVFFFLVLYSFVFIRKLILLKSELLPLRNFIGPCLFIDNIKTLHMFLASWYCSCDENEREDSFY